MEEGVAGEGGDEGGPVDGGGGGKEGEGEAGCGGGAGSGVEVEEGGGEGRRGEEVGLDEEGVEMVAGGVVVVVAEGGVTEERADVGDVS